MAKHYKAYGLRIVSEIEIPELREEPESRLDGIDVRILLESFEHGASPQPGFSFAAGEDEAVFVQPEAAVYRVREGREILVRPFPGADAALVRLYVLGSAMALLLNQRGIVSLHCSAVAIDGLAVAFAGDPGEGKSTLAAHLLGLPGAELVTDDVLAVDASTASVPQAFPGVPQLKLWRKSLTSIGRSASDLRQDWQRADKFHLPARERFTDRPRVLACLYVLTSDEAAGDGRFERLRGAEAVGALIRHTYRLGSLDDARQRPAHFRQLVDIAGRVEIWRFRRARNLDRVHVSAHMLLERHIAPEPTHARG